MANTLPAPGLIDTDVLIDAERRVAAAGHFLVSMRAAAGIRISVVSAMEQLSGARNGAERQLIQQFLSTCVVEVIDDSISKLALSLVDQYALSHRLQAADALIAATAIQLALPLYTKNAKHFQMIVGLNVLKPN